MNNNYSREQVRIIKEAYNKSVKDYYNGISDLDYVPDDFKISKKFRKFVNSSALCNSGDARIRNYLQPELGMKYLDTGSCINLIGYKLYEWYSLYYGIDISQRLVEVTNSYVKANNINLGGLIVSEISDLPFIENYFDIATAIGVLEYYDIEYCTLAFKELNRVVRDNGKLVVDMPNKKHPDYVTMIEYESYLGRPRKKMPSNIEFIAVLKKYFMIEKIDDSRLMIMYFLKNRQ